VQSWVPFSTFGVVTPTRIMPAVRCRDLILLAIPIPVIAVDIKVGQSEFIHFVISNSIFSVPGTPVDGAVHDGRSIDYLQSPHPLDVKGRTLSSLYRA